MRHRKLFKRSCIAIVQQTQTANVRSLFKDLVLGNPVDLKTNGVPGSFDFDGEDVNWDKPLLTEAPNKIEQFLHRDKFVQSDKAVENESPIVTPAPQAEPPSTGAQE